MMSSATVQRVTYRLRRFPNASVLVLGALLASSSGTARPARGETKVEAGTAVADRIARGRAAMENLEFETAAEELTIAAIDSGASDDERIEANLYAGIANRILGNDVEAKLNFVYVLKNQPNVQLPDSTTPKVRNFFELIRQEVELTRVRAPAPAETRRPTQVNEAPPTNPRANSTTSIPSPDTAAPALPAAASSSRDSTSSAFPIVSVLGASAGAALVLGSVATVVLAELALGVPNLDGSAKELAILGFLAAGVTGTVGLLVTVVFGAIGIGGLE